jgi:hypothetical protein
MVFAGDFGRVLGSPRRATGRQSAWIPAGGHYLEFNAAARLRLRCAKIVVCAASREHLALVSI